jgi:pimeloyl-ACP methyl ester carboxylesterase
MIRKFFAIILMFFFSLSAFAQFHDKFIGTWEGKLNVGIELRIVFHILDDGHGGLASTADSPDQNAYGLVCNSTSLAVDQISIEMLKQNAKFSGKLVNDSTIKGTFAQGAEIPLELKKVVNISEGKKLNRPQTPQPPFPYNADSVEYDNENKSVHLGGTLTYPQGQGPFPAAILITGSGQEDRDETLFGHKPFAVIADYLTRHGFAVLRVDDREVGKSRGDIKNATSDDFAKDVMTSMDFLKTRKEIDKNKIGLIGHSEGGLIASIVITKRKDVAFIISLAGPGTKGAEVLADQNEVIMRTEGMDSATAAAYYKLYTAIINHAATEKDSAVAVDKSIKAFYDWKKTVTPEQLKKLQLDNDSDAVANYKKMVPIIRQPWMRYFLKSNPALNYQKAYSPVLALNGSKDIQVVAKKNLSGIRQALQKSKTKNFETRELPGLNHLFQHCKKCDLKDYSVLEETFSTEALEIMGEWLEKNVKK